MMESSSQRVFSSRWLENNSDRFNQSQWLLSTLSDIDNKMNTVLEMIEENGDTLVETGKMFFQKRPKLIELVQDLRKSYISLAHKYGQLKSESALVKSASSNHGGSFSNSSVMQLQQSCTTTFPEPSSRSKSQRLGDQKLVLGSICSELGELGESRNGYCWDELRFEISKLVDDSVSQQAELIRRNDEKRVTIKELEVQVNKLMKENEMLKGSLQGAQEHSCSCDKSTKKQTKKSSSFSKLRGALHFGRQTHS